ncbi:MAG: hypothetical protein RIB71_16120 [Imperialibacter sp.]|uniref:hypothetical protein n=1 Tax=Imperialibacter sp. TaxID=2038411 RepID=UPI0032ECADF2
MNDETIKLLQSFSEQIQKQLKPIQDIALKIGEEFQKTPKSIITLAETGWYLPADFHFPTINEIKRLVDNGEIEKADKEMVSIIDEQTNDIRNGLIEKYPHRGDAIRAGIRAHETAEYYLSVPLFFAQTEGICKEVTGHRFFKMKKGNPETLQWADTYQKDTVISMLLEPLRIAGETRRVQETNKPSGLNRHDVLHGDSYDYGQDKVNSYKALSLLNYVGLTLEELKKW